jgi:fatty-acid desaturase
VREELRLVELDECTVRTLAAGKRLREVRERRRLYCCGLTINEVAMRWLYLTLVAIGITELSLGLNSVYLHRGLTHGAVRFHRYLVACGPLVALALGTNLRTWTAIHRLHHRAPDTDLDAHSPSRQGIAAVRFATPILYLTFARQNRPLLIDAAGDIPNSMPYRLLGSTLVRTALLLALFAHAAGTSAAVFVVLVELALRNVLLGSLNSLHGANGRIRTSHVLVLLIWGEGYHDAHHDAPWRADFRNGRIPDLGGCALAWLCRRGLATKSSRIPVNT